MLETITVVNTKRETYRYNTRQSLPGLVGGRGLGLKSTLSEADMPSESGFGGLCARVVPVLHWRSSEPSEQY